MPDEIKNQEVSSTASENVDKSHEYNSCWSWGTFESLFGTGVYDFFDKAEIDSVLRDPISNHEAAIRLSEFVYTKNGMVSNSIDYQTSLMTLDRVVTSKKKTSKSERNKELMLSTLELIDDKAIIRDGLFTNMVDGIAFKYFETKRKNNDKTKFLSDYEAENIVEINDLGINATVITLPWEYTKIVGRKNNRYVLAFNLDYFSDYTGEELQRKLRKMPQEIVDGYNKKNRKGNWLVLDNDKTMCVKIKCKDSEQWGRSTIIATLADVLYKDYFVDTKRNVLDEVNSQILYETFPEGKDKGSCALNKNQQEAQHNTVKNAVMNKKNKRGLSFFSVAAGTKLDKIDVDVDIFDEKNESNLNNDIACGMGVSASLLGAMTTGSYAGGTLNIEMITSQLYDWICKWKKELVHVINKNIIKDKKNPVDIYYFPTSFVNRKEFFEMMKTLYSEAKGSLTFLIASTGISPDIYMSVLDYEVEKDYENKYPVHNTSWTQSSKNEGGRPPGDNAIQNKGGNSLPSPSDNK